MNPAALIIPLDNALAVHVQGTTDGPAFGIAIGQNAGKFILVAAPNGVGFARKLSSGGWWGVVMPHDGQPIFFFGTTGHQFALSTDANGQLRAAEVRNGEVVWKSTNRTAALTA